MRPDEKRELADKIKAEIKDANDQWERLDSQGTGIEEQNRLADKMERLRKQLKNLTGEESEF